MDFVVPFDQLGLANPGPWQNASPQAGLQGSIVNANVFPAVQTELLNVQDEAGITRDGTNFAQVLQAVRSGKLTFFQDSGTADALVVTPRTSFPSLAAGLELAILKGPNGNATKTPKLSVGGLVLTITKEDASALAPGDLPGNCLFSGRSDGTNFRVTGLRKSDAAQPLPATALWHVGTDTSAAAAHIVATVAPAVSARITDAAYLIIPAHACAGATDIDVGFGPQPMTRNDASALQANDYAANQPLVIVDDGTQFRIVTAIALGAGQGLQKTGSNLALNYPGLAEQDAVAPADDFSYYDISAATHVKIPFSVLAAAVLAGFATQPGSAAYLNPQVLHVEERRAQNVPPQHYASAGTYPRLLNTLVSNQIAGASLDNSGTATQGQITLPAGTYRVWYSTDVHQSGFTVAILYDYTHQVELSRATAVDSNVNNDNDSVTVPSSGCSRFTLASTSVVGLQQLTFTSALGYSGDDSTGYSNFLDSWVHFEKENGQQ